LAAPSNTSTTLSIERVALLLLLLLLIYFIPLSFRQTVKPSRKQKQSKVERYKRGKFLKLQVVRFDDIF
jgi:hypothetical protein